MFVTAMLASTLGKIFQPFFSAMAWLIAGFYAVIPNYAIAIALLTVAVMAVTAPLTIKSTRSMLAMSKLQPQMKELQKKYKGDKVRLNEEMMKLYRENHVSPAAGCVPMLLQFPIFIVLYDTIRGLTNTVTSHGHVIAEPRYISHNTAIYKSLVAHPGHMNSFGINLADTAFSHGLSWAGRAPFIVLILIAIALQYFQLHQMNKRNSANQLNQQMQAMQKFMPLIFAVIYIRIAAGVNVYFIVSSACRIGLQMWAFRSQPAAEEARVGRLGAPSAGGRKRKTLMERLAEAQQRALEQQAQQRQGGPARPAGGQPARPARSGDGGRPSGPAKAGGGGGSPKRASGAPKSGGSTASSGSRGGEQRSGGQGAGGGRSSGSRNGTDSTGQGSGGRVNGSGAAGRPPNRKPPSKGAPGRPSGRGSGDPGRDT